MSFVKKSDGYYKYWIILLVDLSISLLASTLAILLVRALTHPIFNFVYYVIIWFALAAAGSLIGFLLVNSYRVVIRHTTLRNIGQLVNAVIIKEVLLLGCVLSNVWGIYQICELNGGLLLIVLDLLLSIVLLIMARVMVIFVLDNRYDSVEMNVNRLSVMVYGTSNKSVAQVTRMEFSPHYNVVGFLCESPEANGRIIANKKTYYVGNETDFNGLCTSLGGVNCVLFARQEDADQCCDTLVKWCIDDCIHVLVSPKVAEVERAEISPAPAPGSLARNGQYIPDGMTGFERNVKRIVDFLLVSLLIVIFSPLMLICYIAIKAEDHGPALFRQERIGRFGRPFEILKFRSMKMDAEAAGPALYAGEDDPRLTKVGKFLRQHHLDELPQLFNVFKGDMAFVGYRPERQFFIDKIMEVDPRYYYLYQIRPGVTSYATLNNGYTDTVDKMVRRLQYDLYYLKNRSWWFDIKILWLTFMNIAFGKKF